MTTHVITFLVFSLFFRICVNAQPLHLFDFFGIKKDADRLRESIPSPPPPPPLFSSDVKRSQTAVWMGDVVAVQNFLESGVDPKAVEWPNQTPLIWAVRHNAPSLALWLLDMGEDKDATDRFGNTPLLWATQLGLTSLVTLLLERGADPTLGSPLEEASHLGYDDLVSHLQAALNRKLFETMVNGHTWNIHYLVQSGAQINAPTEQGLAPLHYAALAGSWPLCKALLASGADPLLEDHQGKTPLDYAFEGGDRDFILAFIDYTGPQLFEALLRGVLPTALLEKIRTFHSKE